MEIRNAIAMSGYDNVAHISLCRKDVGADVAGNRQGAGG
jgi:hypothetical protein